VFVCSTTRTHADFIEQVARVGKHIFCEKPIALELQRIDRALTTAEPTRAILQVGSQRRFDPSFARTRELVAKEAIGRPHLPRITSRDPEPPSIEYIKVLGGIFLDITIHDFDMARYLMGSEVEEVFAVGATLVDPKIAELGEIDAAVITLRFQSGALGVIDNSCQAVYGYDQRVEVFGEKGMVVVQNPKPDTTVVADKRGYHYVAEMTAFIESILEDLDPPVTGRDGLIAVQVSYTAKNRWKRGRPCDLPKRLLGIKDLGVM